jgi:hypothetical protein
MMQKLFSKLSNTSNSRKKTSIIQMKIAIAVILALTLLAALSWSSAQRQDVHGAVVDRAAVARFQGPLAVAVPLAAKLVGKPAERSRKPSAQAGLPPPAIFCDIDFCRGKERCVDCQIEVKVVEGRSREVSIHYQGLVQFEKLQLDYCEILTNVLVITDQRKAKSNYESLDDESRKQIDETWILDFFEDMTPGVYVKCLNDCYEELYQRFR